MLTPQFLVKQLQKEERMLLAKLESLEETSSAFAPALFVFAAYPMPAFHLGCTVFV
eukprot:m.187121 g.187121  ORF g.187121 m.187121 type:complete len:56 (+) comp18152_c0_seq3:1105-1272(+)